MTSPRPILTLFCLLAFPALGVAQDAAPGSPSQVAPPDADSLAETSVEESLVEGPSEPGVEIAEDSQVRVSFSAIRLYTGQTLQMASSDGDSLSDVCELPCRTRVAAGAYRLNVVHRSGRSYALPSTLHIDRDSVVDLEYGLSTAAWGGGITALTGILGFIITGGVTIAGFANDNPNMKVGGLVGLSLSLAAAAVGTIIYLISERGLRAKVRNPS